MLLMECNRHSNKHRQAYYNAQLKRLFYPSLPHETQPYNHQDRYLIPELLFAYSLVSSFLYNNKFRISDNIVVKCTIKRAPSAPSITRWSYESDNGSIKRDENVPSA